MGSNEAARKLESLPNEHQRMGQKYREGLDAFRQGGFDPKAGDLAGKRH